VQERDDSVHVPRRQGRPEGLQHRALLVEADPRRRVGLRDDTPSAGRVLARCGDRAAQHFGDLDERGCERVVQDEGDALLGGELLQHHEGRHPNALVAHHLVERIGRSVEAGQQRLGQPRPDIAFTDHGGRAQPIQGKAAHGRRQPPAWFADRGTFAVRQLSKPQPRLLHRVLDEGPGDPVGDAEQVGAVPLELGGKRLRAGAHAAHPAAVRVRAASTAPRRITIANDPTVYGSETRPPRSWSST
jgi:hypothetical protein